MQQTGTLYIVATPIGNLSDISQRALQVLADADWIAAEDTRNAYKLLNHFDIKVKCIAYHDHNEAQQSTSLLNLLKSGNNIALISDAGTPLINDPGYRVVRLCRAEGVKVVPVPGASAVIAALSAAGVATDSFYFGGFLPAKTLARKNVIRNIANQPSTSVFYESTHRIVASLADIEETLGEHRYIVVAREISKTFESFYCGSVAEVSTQVKAHPNHQKGEFVVIIEGLKEAHEIDEKCLQLLKKLVPHMPLKAACGIVAETFDVKKNALYKIALSHNDLSELSFKD